MKRRVIILVLSLLFLFFFFQFVPLVLATTYKSDSFENYPTGWTEVEMNGGTASKVSTQKYSGSYSMLISSTTDSSEAVVYNETSSNFGNHHCQIWFRIDSAFSSVNYGGYLCLMYGSGGGVYSEDIVYQWNTSGYMILNYNGSASNFLTYVVADTWHFAEWFVWAGATRKIAFYYDSLFIGNFTTYSTGSALNRWYIGDPSTTAPLVGSQLVYYDSLLCDDNMTFPSAVTASIGDFSAPTRTYSHVWSFWNATVSSTLGNNSLINATLGAYFDGYPSNQTVDVVLLWVNSTNVFSKVFDSTGTIEDLNTTRSSRTSLNSTAFRLSWCVLVSWNCTLGGGGYPNPNGQSVDLTIANTSVTDTTGKVTGSKVGFTIVDNNMKLTNVAISDIDRTNPLQALEFSFRVVINWTSDAFENYTGLAVDLDIIYSNGTYTGLNLTVPNIWNSSGYGTIYRLASSTIANYTYGLSMYSYPQNRWLTLLNAYRYDFIVDKISIMFTVDNSSVLAGEYANFTTVFKSIFDNSTIAGLSYGVYRNASLWQTLSQNATFSDVHPISTYVFALNMTANNWNLTSYTYSGNLTVSWTGEAAEDQSYYIGFGFLLALIILVLAVAYSKD